MPFDVLTINQGSWSLKFALFEGPDHVKLLMRGEIDRLDSTAEFCVRDGRRQQIVHEYWSHEDSGHEAAFRRLLAWLRKMRGVGHLAAVGHRVVHGGDRFTAPVVVTGAVLSLLERYVPLAPLHQPHNLAAIVVLQDIQPELLQIACFDTAFHATIPRMQRRFALPSEYESLGIHRYGFHGLSYQYIAGELRRIAPTLAAGRVVAAHLGSGATLCAMQNGQSVDTTTGLTALDGLPMATRCGAIDPGVLLYLMREGHFGVDELEHLLYHQSGLLGLSGISESMKDLLDTGEDRAKEAIDFFTFRVAREIAALTNTLGGLDALVFTGGIGEHAPAVRSWICQRLKWLGVVMDEAANARDASLVSLPASRVAAMVIPTNEEQVIAEGTLEIAAKRLACSSA
jgi:acetate kinase